MAKSLQASTGYDYITIYIYIRFNNILFIIAQEVRAVVWQQEGCWFDPQALPSQATHLRCSYS